MDNRRRAEKIESLLVVSRLRDLGLEMKEGEESRIARIWAALERLSPGVYLVGAGPYTQGVFPLGRDEVVIGRPATPLEEALELHIDILVNDAATFGPREVSRIHCGISRREVEGRQEYHLRDFASTCGTFHNGVKLEAALGVSREGVTVKTRALADGDVVSLGPSGINNYLFVDNRT